MLKISCVTACLAPRDVVVKVVMVILVKIDFRHDTDLCKNTSQKLNADLTMLGDKLNASFKSIK